METLRKQIGRAHRRLLFQSFAGKLAWCWFASLLAAAVAIGAGKYWPLVDEQVWIAGWLAGALVIGLATAALWTWATRKSILESAIEIDRRFGLKERVSSTLSLDRATLESDIGQALVHDAQQRIGRIDLADGFRVRLDRRALLPLLPAALAFALAVGIHARVPENKVAAATAEKEQVKKTTKALASKLEQQRKEAAENGLSEVDTRLLKEIEEATKNLAEKAKADRQQTLVALNDLAKQAEKRRQELSASDLKQHLNQLKNLQQGPAEKLGKALKNSDLQAAMKELDKLKAELNDDKLDEAAKAALTKQLDELQQAVEKKVQAQKQAQEDLKQQVEAQKQAGNTAAADKLQQQLEKMMEKAAQTEKLGQMSQKLKEAADSMKNGDCKQAAEALSQLGEQLAGMQQEMEEMQMLENALEDMGDAKKAMACKECEGAGCEDCQGDGEGMRDRWSRSKMARGAGIGAGDRPEEKTDTQFYDSQVKQNVKKGASVVTGIADGPNRKGQVQEEIKGNFTNAKQQTAEALSGQRLPHDYRDHAKKYFDALREGQ